MSPRVMPKTTYTLRDIDGTPLLLLGVDLEDMTEEGTEEEVIEEESDESSQEEEVEEVMGGEGKSLLQAAMTIPCLVWK